MYVTEPTKRPMAVLTTHLLWLLRGVIGYLLVIRGRTSTAP